MHFDWILANAPDIPPELVSRVRLVLERNTGWEELALPEALLLAGDELLASVLRAGNGEARAGAMDLLSADACVTWAFEIASGEPGTLSARAESAIQRIAEVAL